MDALSAWLQELGLERYAAVFADNDVDLEALRLLTDGATWATSPPFAFPRLRGKTGMGACLPYVCI